MPVAYCFNVGSRGGPPIVKTHLRRAVARPGRDGSCAGRVGRAGLPHPLRSFPFWIVDGVLSIVNPERPFDEDVDPGTLMLPLVAIILVLTARAFSSP
jgi:hypothetical protein